MASDRFLLNLVHCSSSDNHDSEYEDQPDSRLSTHARGGVQSINQNSNVNNLTISKTYDSVSIEFRCLNEANFDFDAEGRRNRCSKPKAG